MDNNKLNKESRSQTESSDTVPAAGDTFVPTEKLLELWGELVQERPDMHQFRKILLLEEEVPGSPQPVW